MHCVQACLQMLLYAFNKPVLSLERLDVITHHSPDMMTWMSEALIWLIDEGFAVENYENLDYVTFASLGVEYLKQIWDRETFVLQKKYSDLVREQIMAEKLIESGVRTVNSRLSLEEIKEKISEGFFTMLSVNPHALKGREGYGSHLVVVKSIGPRETMLFDPDMDHPYIVSNGILSRAISEERKQDFNAIFVKRASSNRHTSIPIQPSSF